MQQNDNRRKVLLLEPNYANKYPPIGLMKISTYHKMLGDEVVFYKGELKNFILERITEKCINELTLIDADTNWNVMRDSIMDFIRTRKKEFLEQLDLDSNEQSILLSSILCENKDFYWKKTWEKQPEWDRVFVTTLFTFYWDITIDTINFAKKLVKEDGLLQVGGVLATIQADEIEKATGIRPHLGVLNIPGELDPGDDKIIDNLPLDYSILDEIEYKYPMTNAYYGYTTRGCIRKCPFCAVPILEPEYNGYIPLKERIEHTNEFYGEQKDLLLMDNNVLASDNFPQIINDIRDCGFYKGAKYFEPDQVEIAARNLRNGINDRAYIRKLQSLLLERYHKIRDKETSFAVYKVLTEYHLMKFQTTTKDNLLAAYEMLQPLFRKANVYKRNGKLRYVDFNQGVDARLFTEDNVKLMGTIAINPLRVAFDSIKTRTEYERAIRLSVQEGILHFSNYLLYNFTDKPIELYQRLKINIDLCEELDVSIYSFPMKYHPINGEFSHNRDFIGKHWNRKYIRAVQAILNSTKGKIGRGESFFYKAFGHSESEYVELLEMPETFILYRYFFEWLNGRHKASPDNWRRAWNKCKESMPADEWAQLLEVIHTNDFSQSVIEKQGNPLAKELLDYYINYRKDVELPGNELYELKCEYDSNPTIPTRRKKITINID